ncbi:MAG: respiratory nitrate reductase subunit gamma, partial [Desulfotomaculales bacterium]
RGVNSPVVYFIVQILPYIALTIFVFGLLYRLGRWAAARLLGTSHEITLAPFPQTPFQAGWIFIREIALFRNLFFFEPALWVGAWPMHIALFMVLGGHAVGFYFLGEQFVYLGMSPELSKFMSNLLGSVFGLIVLAGLIYLLVRRAAVERVRLVSNPSDYLHLVLLIAIVTIGDIMRYFPQYGMHYEEVQEYFKALIFFQPVPEFVFHNVFFILHLLCVQILMIVFPFSKLVHLFGMFALRWIENRVHTDPEPGLPNVDVAAARAKGTGLPTAGGAA